MTRRIEEQKYIEGLVSVIIPVYNAEKFLSETLESVFHQSYKNIEVIVIDDCSSDHSDVIIHDYMKEHKNLYYYKQEKNMGVSAARNRAVLLAKGQYVAFVDSDDVWDANKIEKQVAMLDRTPHAPMCFTAIRMIDENSKLIKGKRKVSNKIGYKRLLHNTMIATSSVMINRNIVNIIEMPDRKSCEDYSLWLAITRDYGAAVGINEDLVAYRKSSGQATNNRIGEVHHFYEVQVEDHHINRFFALFNTLMYILLAVKKHFL